MPRSDLLRRDPAAAAWRLLLHASADGAWNMAVDEALLESYAGAAPPAAPTLRLYGFRPATLSLGRLQAAAGAHDPRYLREQGIGLVRRPTGGRAVLHEHERTYALVAGLDGPFAGTVGASYRAVAEALAVGLGRLGLDLAPLPASGAPHRGGGPSCFASAARFELGAAGRKVVGSAQLRRRRAFLQHGSIRIRADAARLDAALGGPADHAGSTDLTCALGRTPEPDEIDRCLAAGFAERFGIVLAPGELTAGERLRTERLRAWKYESACWTLEGRLGSRERRWGPAP